MTSTTSSCLQSKIDSLKQQVNIAKLSVKNCLSTDEANETLLQENLLLTSKLQQYEKNNKDDTTSLSTTVPIVSVTLFYFVLFFIIGLFYNVLLSKSIISIMKNQDYVNNLDNNESFQEKWKQIRYCLNQYRFVLFCVVFITTFTVNFGIMYSLILKGSQNMKAMKVISLCIFAIIGVTFLLVNNINFNKVFENTIGYFLVQFLSPKKNISFTTFMNSLFTHNIFPKGGIDFSFLFSFFRLDNFGNVLKDIGIKSNGKYDFHLNELHVENMDLLTNMVVTKNTVGHMSWILFSTVACTFISLKYLMKSL